MLSNNIINSDSEIELYNWGEPLLNPQLEDILAVIEKYKLSFHISTNASVIENFKGNHINRMTLFMVSLSGFSQNTYSKIHGLNLNTVLSNIDKIALILKDHNKLDRMQINMHMYKFNLSEYELARNYFKERGIKFIPHLAYFNDYIQFQDYLCNTQNKKTKEATNKHIITTIIDDVATESPKKYKCPQLTKIVTDEKWNVVPCCRLTTDQSLGNLFDMTIDEILCKKKNCQYCPACIESGQSYIVHQPLKFSLGII